MSARRSEAGCRAMLLQGGASHAVHRRARPTACATCAGTAGRLADRSWTHAAQLRCARLPRSSDRSLRCTALPSFLAPCCYCAVALESSILADADSDNIAPHFNSLVKMIHLAEKAPAAADPDALAVAISAVQGAHTVERTVAPDAMPCEVGLRTCAPR